MADYGRILLTGGDGFVGSALAGPLAAAYPAAQRFVLLRDAGSAAPAQWTPRVADLCDAGAVARIVAETQPDLVVHLAGQASVAQAINAAEQTWRVNFLGSFHLAAALAQHAPRTVALFASSATVYGDTLRDGALDETAPPRPRDPYGRSKLAAEDAMGDLLGAAAKLIVARPVNHSGPGQNARNFVLSSFAAQIAAIEAGRQEPRLLVGDLDKSRDFLDVRDVVAAYLALIAAAPGLPGGVSRFNVASGAPVTIRACLDRLRAQATRAFSVDIDPKLLRPPGVDIDCITLDSAKLRAVAGWRPQLSTEALLASLLDHWRSEERRRG
jgi:GDP-4-dehydro-6-deoxy-D-mannose reductase